jgi:hypothetical protein
MHQVPNTDHLAGQPQTGPAPSTTDWGKAPPVAEITQFLQGPQKRGFELGRAFGIFFEIMRGFRSLHFVGPCVTVFGSARFTAEHQYYVLARDVGQRLARAGFTVMTGGGPGIMGRQLWRQRSRWLLNRLQHRVAAGTEAQPLP